MSQSDEQAPRRPHPQAMAAPYLEFNLAREIDDLQREPDWSRGHNAKTLVKYDDFRVVLMMLKAGGKIPGHRTEGRISIQAVRGHVQVRAEGRTFEMRAGALLALDHGVTHDVEAFEDSAIVLTIAWPHG